MNYYFVVMILPQQTKKGGLIFNKLFKLLTNPIDIYGSRRF